MENNNSQLPRRVHYKVDKLPQNLKNKVIESLKCGISYEQISNELQNEEYFVSKSAICRYYKLLQRLGII